MMQPRLSHVAGDLFRSEESAPVVSPAGNQAEKVLGDENQAHSVDQSSVRAGENENASRSQDPSCLAHDGPGVFDVFEHLHTDDSVERVVGKGEVLTTGGEEFHPCGCVAEVGLSHPYRGDRRVDRNHGKVASVQGICQPPAAGAHIQNAVRSGAELGPEHALDEGHSHRVKQDADGVQYAGIVPPR